MSLISQALQKADHPAPAAAPPPAGGKPRWLYGAASLAALALLVVLIPRGARRGVESKPAMTAAASNPAPTQLAKANLGLNLLRSAESQWRLSGVIAGGQGKSLALINEQVVEEGGTIGRATVTRVTRNEVDLEEDGQTRTLKLK
ncbi:MAG: hypothetical protein HYS41_03850 [Candidatus Omnitrophica bacterium]|nr:hypothetical protein [Candidatus Omnitrophota bacterium]